MSIERIVPGTKEWEAFYANHIQRYMFAKEQVNGSGNILDAACGVGYGSNFLAQGRSCRVMGIDINQGALATAKKLFLSDNVEFALDDCNTLTEAGKKAPYDNVVSFETLEHLKQPEVFLSNIFGLLNSNGVLIISTPNAHISSPSGVTDWEYHEKEYKATELADLLRKTGFFEVKIYGQQFNMKGRIKNELRAELNVISSNPFQRLGRFLQKYLRRKQFSPVLKETIDDMEIVPYSTPEEVDRLGAHGPFVLIAVAKKQGTTQG